MSSSNKRTNFRVEILVPVNWETLNDEEIKLVKQGLGDSLFKEEELPGPIDEFIEQAGPGSKEEQLYRSLQHINNKLDFIIEQLASDSLDKQHRIDNVIDISASGLKFATDIQLGKGTLLKMKLILPGTFQYQMNLIAEVLRYEKIDNAFITAARIVYIDEEARDSIIKVVFQKQRKDIRKQKVLEEKVHVD